LFAGKDRLDAAKLECWVHASTFITRLIDYDKDNISEKESGAELRRVMQDPAFTPEQVRGNFTEKWSTARDDSSCCLSIALFSSVDDQQHCVTPRMQPHIYPACFTQRC